MTDNDYNEGGEEFFDAFLNSDSISQGLGTAVGMYYGGPVGGAIGSVLGEPVWDATVNFADSFNGGLNQLVGANVFPLFGNFGATYSDGTPSGPALVNSGSSAGGTDSTGGGTDSIGGGGSLISTNLGMGGVDGDLINTNLQKPISSCPSSVIQPSVVPITPPSVCSSVKQCGCLREKNCSPCGCSREKNCDARNPLIRMVCRPKRGCSGKVYMICKPIT